MYSVVRKRLAVGGVPEKETLRGCVCFKLACGFSFVTSSHHTSQFNDSVHVMLFLGLSLVKFFQGTKRVKVKHLYVQFYVQV